MAMSPVLRSRRRAFASGCMRARAHAHSHTRPARGERASPLSACTVTLLSRSDAVPGRPMQSVTSGAANTSPYAPTWLACRPLFPFRSFSCCPSARVIRSRSCANDKRAEREREYRKGGKRGREGGCVCFALGFTTLLARACTLNCSTPAACLVDGTAAVRVASTVTSVFRLSGEDRCAWRRSALCCCKAAFAS